jgi:WhiB family redox-sensing transcriptional regulator
VSIQRVDDLWQGRAACRGPNTAVFFPPSHFERKDDRELRETRAKAICRSCPVRRDCLEYALRIHEQHGIWGGLNEAERRLLLTP